MFGDKKAKYVRIVYNMLHNDGVNSPNKVKWVTMLRNSLGNIGFMDVWLQESEICCNFET